MDKQKDVKKVKISELPITQKNTTTAAGCIHYKRKAKFVVSIPLIHVQFYKKNKQRKVEEVVSSVAQ